MDISYIKRDIHKLILPTMASTPIQSPAIPSSYMCYIVAYTCTGWLVQLNYGAMSFIPECRVSCIHLTPSEMRTPL